MTEQSPNIPARTDSIPPKKGDSILALEEIRTTGWPSVSRPEEGRTFPAGTTFKVRAVREDTGEIVVSRRVNGRDFTAIVRDRKAYSVRPA